MTISEYRKSLGLTQEAFAESLGLKSKGFISEIERDNQTSPEVALSIETHSGGLVDAGQLNAIVRAARQGLAA